MQTLLETLMISIALLAVTSLAPAAETITVRGHTYTVFPDEEMEKLGFEFPQPPPEENAAVDYLEAVEKYEEISKELTDLRDYTRIYGWIAESDGLVPYLQANRGILEILRGAAAKPSCHFPFLEEGSIAPPLVPAHLPNYAQMRELARFLTVFGRHSESKGDYASALDTYLLILRVGKHVSDEPLFVDGLVGVGIQALGHDAIRDTVLRHDIDAATLRAFLTRAAPVIMDRPELLKTMAGERVWSTLMLEEQFRLAPATIKELFCGWEGPLWPLLSGSRAGFPSLLLACLPPAQERTRGQLSLLWDIRKEIYETPLPEFLEQRETIEKTLERFAGSLPQWSLLVRYYDDLPGDLVKEATAPKLAYARHEARANLAIVAVALQLYHKEHGAFPANLDAVREYLDPIPNDPYTGKSLQYRPEGDGWILHSVDEDLEDDAGKSGDLAIVYPPEPPPSLKEYLDKLVTQRHPLEQ